jgi:hypothetical protein
MFAPHHQQAADELVRVCRPGGTIGLLNWTPQGFIGRMFATMKPYAPPPPPGAQPPPLWGDEDHVRALLGDRVTDVRAERRTVRVDRFGTPEAFRDYFKERYGPTITVYKSIAGDPDCRPGPRPGGPRPRRRPGSRGRQGVGVPAVHRAPGGLTPPVAPGSDGDRGAYNCRTTRARRPSFPGRIFPAFGR